MRIEFNWDRERGRLARKKTFKTKASEPPALQTGNHMSTHYDITIIGAGMVGLACANMLANSNLKIAVIDQKLPIINLDENATPDLRVSAITLGSKNILEQTHAWQLIPAKKISPFKKMQVWDAIGGSNINFCSSELIEQQLGYIVENNILQSALYTVALNNDNITFIAPTELTAIEVQDAKVILNLKDKQVTTKLLIGADGGKSKVRELSKIAIKQNDYGHSALVCHVKTELPHQQTARQVFLEQGPLAFLPLTDPHWCSMVWSAQPEVIKELLSLDVDQFKQRLNAAFKVLGEITEVSERAAFPLRMQHVKNYVLPRIALIGDAAHTIHPLAGQGVNLGFADAKLLAETILTAHAKNKDIGALAVLRPYERERKTENTKMLAFVEIIKKIFSQQNSVLRTVANIGFGITNKLSPLKQFFIRQAVK